MGSNLSKMDSNKGLKQDEIDLIESAISSLRQNGFNWSVYKRQVKEWKMLKLNFALIGSSQSGKSSFINTVNGLKSYEDGPAAVGIEGSTSKPTEYTHPEKNTIKLWDLPGLGTLENPDLETYCNNIGNLEMYDAFLVFSKSRFTNRESDLVEKISKKSGKPFFYICTYVDVDVQNIKVSKGKDKLDDDEQQSALSKIRNGCWKNLKHLVEDETDLYLIDTRFKEKYDFSRLNEDVCGKLLHRRLKLFLHYLNGIYYERSRLSKIYATLGKHDEHDPEKIYENIIESLTNIEINLAITGDFGTGKSSFINAVRGMKANEEGAAKVGVTETTLVATKYFHPNNKKIILWDLPGIGQPTYLNLEDYCKKVGGLEKYDAFLIFCKTRFTQHDKKLAEKVSKDLNKPFFFVRTNVKYDIDNAKHDDGQSCSEEFILEIMREDCLENIKGLIDDEKDIYMIDNKAPSKYDFQRLKEAIAKGLLAKPKESFVDSLFKSPHYTIRTKANLLKDQTLLVTKALSYDPATSKPQMSTSDLDLVRGVILRKLIPRLHNALNVPKEKSDEIIKELLMEEHFKSMDKLALEVIVYFLLQYIDRLEKYALQQVNSSNN